MASTYSPNLRIELIATGEQSNTWGGTTNNNLGTLIEQAISGLVSIDVTAGDVTLTALNGTSDQSRQMIIVATGTPGVARVITAPAVNKVYIVYNNSTAASLVWANTTANKVVIRVSGKGDIFQGDTAHDNDGVFARLARLERLMGIMQRDHHLERDYEPMRELGESYDDAIDSAIQQIMDAALHQLKHMEDEYECMREQAEMWRALTRDDD
jgi:hypothetical protein